MCKKFVLVHYYKHAKSISKEILPEIVKKYCQRLVKKYRPEKTSSKETQAAFEKLICKTFFPISVF